MFETVHFIFANYLTFCVQYNSIYPVAGFADRQFSGSAWPFGEICLEFYKINFSWNYRLMGSFTVH
jgi:hypothetical protein